MKRCAAQIDNNCKKIKLLDKRTNELSRCYVKEEEKIPYVFTAPQEIATLLVEQKKSRSLNVF
jgi:hypothetical protein